MPIKLHKLYFLFLMFSNLYKIIFVMICNIRLDLITQLQWKSSIDIVVNDLPFISFGDWQMAAISDGLLWSLCTNHTKLQSQTRALLSKRRRVIGPTLWKASAGRWCSMLLCKKSLSSDGKSLKVFFFISLRWL